MLIGETQCVQEVDADWTEFRNAVPGIGQG